MKETWRTHTSKSKKPFAKVICVWLPLDTVQNRQTRGAEEQIRGYQRWGRAMGHGYGFPFWSWESALGSVVILYSCVKVRLTTHFQSLDLMVYR